MCKSSIAGRARNDSATQHRRTRTHARVGLFGPGWTATVGWAPGLGVFPGPAPRALAAGRYPCVFPVVFLRPDALAVLCWLWAARGARLRGLRVVSRSGAGSGAVPGDRDGTEAARRVASYSSTACRGIRPLGEASS